MLTGFSVSILLYIENCIIFALKNIEKCIFYSIKSIEKCKNIW